MLMHTVMRIIINKQHHITLKFSVLDLTLHVHNVRCLRSITPESSVSTQLKVIESRPTSINVDSEQLETS